MIEDMPKTFQLMRKTDQSVTKTVQLLTKPIQPVTKTVQHPMGIYMLNDQKRFIGDKNCSLRYKN